MVDLCGLRTKGVVVRTDEPERTFEIDAYPITGGRCPGAHQRRGLLRSTVEPLPTRRNFVSFKYGTCDPTPEAACGAPLEIQIWPACERNRSMYTLTPDPDGPGPLSATPLPRTDLRSRGVPASFFENGHRLELYTAGMVIRAGQRPAVLISVPLAWRHRASITWGNNTGRSYHSVRFARCPPLTPSHSWNGYAGLFYLSEPSDCVPLAVTVGRRRQIVWFGLGERCRR